MLFLYVLTPVQYRYWALPHLKPIFILISVRLALSLTSTKLIPMLCREWNREAQVEGVAIIPNSEAT